MRLDSLARLLRVVIILPAFSLMSLTIFAQTGKPPLIIIPGITGSELVDSETGKILWFSFRLSRGETDDLRLPMSANLSANRDRVVAKDIIRDISCGSAPRLPRHSRLRRGLKSPHRGGLFRSDLGKSEGVRLLLRVPL